jgi:hypothetical protein
LVWNHRRLIDTLFILRCHANEVYVRPAPWSSNRRPNPWIFVFRPCLASSHWQIQDTTDDQDVYLGTYRFRTSIRPVYRRYYFVQITEEVTRYGHISSVAGAAKIDQTIAAMTQALTTASETTARYFLFANTT